LRIRVKAEEWWWRVEYFPPGNTAPIISANEIRLPVGQRTELELQAARGIHSLWIPTPGGKTDMIPGRVNRMSLEPQETGIFRG